MPASHLILSLPLFLCSLFPMFFSPSPSVPSSPASPVANRCKNYLSFTKGKNTLRMVSLSHVGKRANDWSFPCICSCHLKLRRRERGGGTDRLENLPLFSFLCFLICQHMFCILGLGIFSK